MLEIDVEGSEWAVLEGSRRTLEQARPAIWLEYWPDGIRANGHEPRDVLDLFERLGYVTTAHDLVIESPVEVTGQGVCDEATERFKQAGRTELHGILYLHAAQPAGTAS